MFAFVLENIFYVLLTKIVRRHLLCYFHVGVYFHKDDDLLEQSKIVLYR